MWNRRGDLEELKIPFAILVLIAILLFLIQNDVILFFIAIKINLQYMRK